MTNEDKIKAKIDEFIDALNKNCDPNPFGNTIQCMAAAQIEVLTLIKDYANSLQADK